MVKCTKGIVKELARFARMTGESKKPVQLDDKLSYRVTVSYVEEFRRCQRLAEETPRCIGRILYFCQTRQADGTCTVEVPFCSRMFSPLGLTRCEQHERDWVRDQVIIGRAFVTSILVRAKITGQRVFKRQASESKPKVQACVNHMS